MPAVFFCVLALGGLAAAGSNAEEWDDFTNNFATDIAPIIALFGEQATKQFLSESTSVLDNIIFGVAPLGILTAVVSVIRVYGNASLKSFIGRAQEAHGMAEAELCSCTSHDVCELWSNGGICRVFGRPKILEFFFTQGGDFYPKFTVQAGKGRVLHHPSCGIKLPRVLLPSASADAAATSGPCIWAEVNSRASNSTATLVGTSPSSASSDNHEIENGMEGGNPHERFAPYPNLSLNIGIRTTPRSVQLAAVIFGVLLQLSFFAFTSWMTFYSNTTEGPPQLWSFCLAVSGTALLVFGMIMCAVLIERKSCERVFVRKCDETTPGPKTAICWLQPGGQRVGDQLFNAFAHLEKKRQYVTSWRVDSEPSRRDPDSIGHSFPLLLVAVSSSILGFAFQFVGLRGLHGSIALYQLASTLCMAVVRALLRSRRLNWEANSLKDLNRDVEGHELDWRALNLESVAEDESRPIGAWHISDRPHPFKSSDTDHSQQSDEVVEVLTSTNQDGAQIVGFRPAILEKQEYNRLDLEVQCANSAVAWLRLNEEDQGQPNEAARILYFRFRLAYLTSGPIILSDQAWDTEVRAVAGQLQEALQDSAEYIFSNNVVLPAEWNDAKAIVWSTTCQLALDFPQSPDFPIHFLMRYNDGRWEISKHQLEAAIGLWWWSLKQVEGHSILFSSKNMIVQEKDEASAKSAIRLWITQTHSILGYRIPNDPAQEPTHYPTALSVLSSWENRSLDSGASPTASDAKVLLAIKSRGTPLQKIAQDIFTIFICRIADIMNPLKEVDLRQGQATALGLLENSLDQPYIGLTNLHVQSIANTLVAANLASQEEALMSIVPPLLQRSKLPQLEDVMDDLLARARAFRRSSEFQRGEDLLKSMFYLCPHQFRRSIIIELGESYRAAIRSKQKEQQAFGCRGFKSMMETYTGQQLSAEAEESLGHYRSVWSFFGTRDIHNHVDRHVPNIESGKWFGFVKDLGKQPTRPRALTLIDEIDFRKGRNKDLQPILKWAIKQNCPELIEDLWQVRRILIDEADYLSSETPIFWAIGCERETLQRLLEWPSIRLDAHDRDGMTPLLRAVQKGYPDAVELFLQHGADAAEGDRRGQTPLSMAAEAGYHEIVNLLVKVNVDVDLPFSNSTYGNILEAAADHGWIDTVRFLVQERLADVNYPGHLIPLGGCGSALAAASYRGRAEIVQFLMYEGKADVNLKLQNSLYGNALAAAADAGHIEIVKMLIHEGKANVDAYALEAAVRRGRIDIVRYLILEEGADINAPCSWNNCGNIVTLAVHLGNADLVRFLVNEAKADVNIALQHGNMGSALSAAVLKGNTDIVTFLVEEAKADVNMPLQVGGYDTALEAAATRGSVDIVRFLVQKGKADVNRPLRNSIRGNVITAAATSSNPARIEIMRFLIQHGGADVNQPLKHGIYSSTLAAAAFTLGGQVNTLEFLIREGKADVNRPLYYGSHGNALIAAAGGGGVQQVKFLIQKGGADVNMAVEHGQYGSALAAAISVPFGNVEMVKFLVQKGRADVNMPLRIGPYGSALAVAVAAHEPSLEIVRFLIQPGNADVNMLLQNGRYGSALATAAYWGRDECIKILVEAGAEVNLKLKYGYFETALQAALSVLPEDDERVGKSPQAKERLMERKAKAAILLKKYGAS